MTSSLNSVVPLALSAVEEVRRISKNLRPTILDDFGIDATLSRLCQEFATTFTGIILKKEVDIKEEEVPDILKIVIFRMSQEALNNMTKHSHADRIDLSLKKIGPRIELTISDNGVGFELDRIKSGERTDGGVGLAGMKEPTSLSGGPLTIKSRRGTGTTIQASLKRGQAPG